MQMPTSPIPTFSPGRSPMALGSPSFSQQQLLGGAGFHSYSTSASGLSSPAPFDLNSRPASPYDANFGQYTRYQSQPHPSHHHQHQQRYHFAHTPGAPVFHPAQHAPYLQHLRSELAAPKPLRPTSKMAAVVAASEAATNEASISSALDTSSSSAANLSSSSAEGMRGSAESNSTSKAKEASQRQNAQASGFRGPPGMISLPPQSFTMPNPMSPLMTRGIPITPSMPGFTFHAPVSLRLFLSHVMLFLTIYSFIHSCRPLPSCIITYYHQV